MIELGCSQSLVVEPFHDAHKHCIRSLYGDLLYFSRLVNLNSFEEIQHGRVEDCRGEYLARSRVEVNQCRKELRLLSDNLGVHIYSPHITLFIVCEKTGIISFLLCWAEWGVLPLNPFGAYSRCEHDRLIHRR